MKRYISKGLQAVGIVLAGMGLIFGFTGSMSKELTYAIVGAAVFFAGWLVEKKQ